MLTKRQHGIVVLLANGHAPKEIAHRLGLSPRTVECHLQHVRAKLKVNTVGLILWAVRNKIVKV